jgi:hypothetical protein
MIYRILIDLRMLEWRPRKRRLVFTGQSLRWLNSRIPQDVFALISP